MGVPFGSWPLIEWMSPGPITSDTSNPTVPSRSFSGHSLAHMSTSKRTRSKMKWDLAGFPYSIPPPGGHTSMLLRPKEQVGHTPSISGNPNTMTQRFAFV